MFMFWFAFVFCVNLFYFRQISDSECTLQVMWLEALILYITSVGGGPVLTVY